MSIRVNASASLLIGVRRRHADESTSRSRGTISIDVSWEHNTARLAELRTGEDKVGSVESEGQGSSCECG